MHLRSDFVTNFVNFDINIIIFFLRILFFALFSLNELRGYLFALNNFKFLVFWELWLTLTEFIKSHYFFELFFILLLCDLHFNFELIFGYFVIFEKILKNFWMHISLLSNDFILIFEQIHFFILLILIYLRFFIESNTFDRR